MTRLASQLMEIRSLEIQAQSQQPNYRRFIRTALVTARDALAHKRLAMTLSKWGIEFDYAFFMGGLSKKPVLNTLKPHLYFDDQAAHFDGVDGVPLVHVPFGIANL